MTSISLRKYSEIQSRRQSYLCELSENYKMRGARWDERHARGGQIAELVGGQNPGPVALSRSKIGWREEGAKEM